MSPLIPEGTSIDIQYGFFKFIFSIIFFKLPEIFFFKPEPKMPSIITSLLDILKLEKLLKLSPNFSAANFASPFNFFFCN